MPTQKIRPPTHSSFQEQAEAELPDQVTAPDPGRFNLETRDATSHIQEGTRQLSAAEVPTLPPEQQPNLYEAAPANQAPNFTLSPDEAAAERARVAGLVNALGKPFQPNPAELLMQEYRDTLEAFKADYAKDGKRSMALEPAFLDVRQRMIEARLLPAE